MSKGHDYGWAMKQICRMARERPHWPFETADWRLEIGRDCVLIRLQDAGTDVGPICLRLRAFGLGPPSQHPRLGDYLANCLRGCLDRYLVLRREGNLGHRLPDYLSGHGPESFVRRLPGNPVCSGTGCGRGHRPVHPTGNSAHHPSRNGVRDSTGYLRDYEARRPSHHEGRDQRVKESRGPVAAAGDARRAGCPHGTECRSATKHHM